MRYAAAVLAFFVLLAVPAAGMSATVCNVETIMEDYLTRHVTLWYLGEDEFIRVEDSFRISTDPLVGRYGPENDFLELRIEEVYGIVSRRLGIEPYGFRVELQIVPVSNEEEYGPPPDVGRWLDETGADYDRRSNTIYIESTRVNPETLAAGLAIALLYSRYDFTPPPALVRSALKAVGDISAELGQQDLFAR